MAGQLADLIPDVLKEITKCSRILAQSALEDATIQFFKASLCKNVTLDEIPITAAVADYALSNPEGFQIISPRFAEYNRQALSPTSEEALDLDWGDLARSWTYTYPNRICGPGTSSENWRYATSDRPWLFYCPTPNALRLVGIPSSVPDVAGLNVNVYCHPIKGVTSIDDWIFNSWNDVITLRAIADLKMMKDKAFYDLRGAAVAGELYDERVGKLTDAALRGHQRNNRQNRRVKVWN